MKSRWNKEKQRGQAMVEYVVIVAAIIAALYYTGQDDVMQSMRDAMKGSQEGYSYAISIAELPDENDATP
ncbi:hypothetical protein MNBD_GAMMA23-661 [hydrothermal vent metagenome]|uniref:Uncharacterized protein n=1 Tax=hydrothermal vent metagenome TaxID=652676 RepID=A0A3B1A600_9ZZZZ